MTDDPTGDVSDDASQSPWRTQTLPRDGAVDVGIGPLHLLLRERAGEIQLAHRRDDDPPDSDLQWARFAPGSWNGEVTVTPAFPDRTVIVAPDDTFRLLEGAEARIYVRLPLFAQVQVQGRSGTTVLARIPTVHYSDTWWGVPTEGELCYWLSTSARRSVTPELFEDHLALCPLQLMNRSEGDLDVEKIALRVAFLSLFQRDRRLWADETRVRYQGEAEGSTLDMAGAPPKEEPGAELVLGARERIGRGFRARTFARLRSLQHWI